MQLSKSFTLEEAVFSETAARKGIDNSPSSDIIENMKLAAGRLQLFRDDLNQPILVNSWYRCRELNEAIPGSAKTSAHITGWAIDCKVAGLTPHQVCKLAYEYLRSNSIGFDQIIHEFGSWMHVSFEPTGRGQLLTIFAGGGYKSGILTKEEYERA